MTKSSIASLTNISKNFSVEDISIRVLFDISFELYKGELTMLVGPSGCGKTTLISILSGILSPSEGKVMVMGKDITAMGDTEKVLFRREHIGFIFQQYNLLPSLTASENAAMPLYAAEVSEEEAVEKARQILNSIEMNGHTEKLPRQLSGGQQQRVAIARALVHEPQLIICDEPTASLDAKSGAGVMEILQDIACREDRSVLVVSHDSRTYKYANRILEMSDGKIIGDYDAKTFSPKE